MQTAEQVIDSRAFSDFRARSSPDDVPDGETNGRFRNLIISAGVQETLFIQVVALLKSKDMILKKRHHCRFNHHQCTQLNEEQGTQP